MPGFQSTRLATDGALEPFYFLYTDDSIQGNPETCKQSSIMLNYEIKNSMIRNFAEYNERRITVNDDICATAKGYERMLEMKLIKNGGAL